MRHLKLVGATLAALYLAAVAVLWAIQRELLYSPEHVASVTPSYYPMLDGVQEVELTTADGLKLRAWYAPAPTRRPTVVLFMGKSGSLRSQRYRLKHFADAAMGALLVAYRGYSGNAGVPTEQGLYADARAALDWLNAHGVDDSSIVAYGASLGSGVATKMAAERELGAVVLEAPYTSTVDVAALRFPLVPVGWLMKDRFESLARIDAVTEPLLVMHGDRDAVIPQYLGLRLFAAAHSPKEGFWPHGVGHNDLFDRGGCDAARAFVERSMRRSKSPKG